MFEKKIKFTKPSKEFNVIYLDSGLQKLQVLADSYTIDSDEKTLNFENEEGDIIASFMIDKILGVK